MCVARNKNQQERQHFAGGRSDIPHSSEANSWPVPKTMIATSALLPRPQPILRPENPHIFHLYYGLVPDGGLEEDTPAECMPRRGPQGSQAALQRPAGIRQLAGLARGGEAFLLGWRCLWNPLGIYHELACVRGM